MSNLVEFAKSEMDIAWPESDDLQDLVKKNVLELLEVFSEQGHSGYSAPYILDIFERLAHWLPIKPLTGEDDEWNEPWVDIDDEPNLQQNKRCSHVFRYNFDNSTAHDSRGKVFVDKNGRCYTCAKSSVPITFPYIVPDKPEYVKDYEEDI